MDHEVDKHYGPEFIARLTIRNRDAWVSRPFWLAHAVAGRCIAGHLGVRYDTNVIFARDVRRANLENVELVISRTTYRKREWVHPDVRRNRGEGSRSEHVDQGFGF